LPKENFVTGTKSDNWFDESFKFVLPGYNVRPLEMSGAIGQEQLKKLPSFIKTRRINAIKFLDIMKNFPDIIVQQEIGESSWFGFSIVLKKTSKISRNNLFMKLNKAGIESRPIVAGNFVKNEVIKYFDYQISDKLTNANWLHEKGLFIGNFHKNLNVELDYFHDVLSKIYK
jgi:CDP-6-deoxy-D-xylo-4-hexulose-3-dehydrase